ncbi:3386_t:CDS:2 [Funneliformis caledonium]|uniref:3386_t:CDS:1 n=1 Tax=Funneliformis caledonium TaxID=1117310 RepID=A0A9N9NA91_9GLOM|nr:3386_t:CDS:2 [Funneliformis caledonium]
MSDSESISSDNDIFDFEDNFIEDIPRDSDCDDDNSYSSNKNINILPLKLEAQVFNTTIFTIDIQTISHCESVNAIFKYLLHNSNNTLIDIFFTIKEQLEEEQDNIDYLNWQNSFLTIQSSIIASNVFANMINKLKNFTTSSIQKIHNTEMELAFSYNTKLLDQSWINHLFYSASKFEMNIAILLDNPFNFFNSTNINPINNIYTTISKQKLYYMNIQGLSKQACQIAYKTNDESFVTLLEKYITKKNCEALEFTQVELLDNQNISNIESDQKNANQLGNSIIRRPKKTS